MLIARRPLPAAVLTALALVPAMTGCGGGPESPDIPPAAALDHTFSHLPGSGVAEIEFEATVPRGAAQVPVTAKLEGPFAAGAGGIPSFDFDVDAEAAGFGVDGKLVSTGDAAFVVFFGENFRVPAGKVAVVDQDLRRATAQVHGRGLAGLDVRRWFEAPHFAGREEVAGVDSYRVEGGFRAGEVSDDLVGLARGLEGDAEAVRQALGHPATGGTIEAWIGADDGMVRRLRIDSGSLHLDVVLSDLGQEQTIEPPPGGGFKPVEQLIGRLRELSGGI